VKQQAGGDVVTIVEAMLIFGTWASINAFLQSTDGSAPDLPRLIDRHVLS